MSDALLLRNQGLKSQDIYMWKKYSIHSETHYEWDMYNAVSTTIYKWNKYNLNITYQWNKWNSTTEWQGYVTQQSGSIRSANSATPAGNLKMSTTMPKAVSVNTFQQPVSTFTYTGSNVTSTQTVPPYAYIPSYYYGTDSNPTSPIPIITNIVQMLLCYEEWESRVPWYILAYGTQCYANSVNVRGNTSYGTVTSTVSTAYPNPGKHTDGYWYESRQTLYSKGSSNGIVESTNSGAYPNNSWSGSFWYEPAGSTISWSKGSTFYQTVSATVSTAYPDNGQQDGYWYDNKQEIIEYSQGDYIEDVLSTNPSKYPTNGIKDNFWYVKTGTI